MWLTIQSGPESGRRTQASGKRFVIGREPTCDLVIDDPKVSREHASIEVMGDGTAVINDLDSANGTHVDGKRIRGPVTLRGGERLKIGDTQIRTEGSSTAANTIVAPSPEPASAPPPPPATSYAGKTGRRRGPRSGLIAAVVVALAVIAVVVLFATGVIGGGDDDLSQTEVIDRVRPSTVWVESLLGDQRPARGSGWVYDAEQGLVVTNYHVVAPGREFRVGSVDGERDADLVAAAPCADLAVLRVEATPGLRTLPLAAQEDVRQGDEVVALGFPGNASLAAELQATPGSISAVDTTVRVPQPDLPIVRGGLQTDAAINPGNSGGPLVNRRGELVGVNFAGSTANQAQNLALGVDHVRAAVADLAEGRSQGWTGMSIQFGAFEDADSRDLVVVTVVPGTNAADVGFGQGDIRLVTAINNTPIDDGIQSYCAAVRDIQSGDLARFSSIPFVPLPGGDYQRLDPRTDRVQFE